MQHLGHFTFFSALLVAIERSASAAPTAAAGAAAAECLYQAVLQMRGHLLQRLASLAHSPPHLIAVEHFSLLAQVRAVQPHVARDTPHLALLLSSASPSVAFDPAAASSAWLLTFTSAAYCHFARDVGHSDTYVATGGEL